MATLRNIRNISNICKRLNNVALTKRVTGEPGTYFASIQTHRTISTTKPVQDLMEFFDDKANWGATEVKSGRSWNKEELRIKSNSDLHKLWFVLLKERNMLLTMEEESNKKIRVFPSPERLDKVADSMENLEEVVRERNRAYHELETGETGERTAEVRESTFGLRYRYKPTEHLIPKQLNKKWRDRFKLMVSEKEKEEFLKKIREKAFVEKKKKRTRDFNHVIGLMNRFPKLDMDAVRQQYPDVDIEKAKNSRRYRPHYVPN